MPVSSNDPLTRWQRGHHAFVFFCFCLAVVIGDIAEQMKAGNDAGVADRLLEGADLLRAAAASMALAADMSADQYVRLVRPTMEPVRAAALGSCVRHVRLIEPSSAVGSWTLDLPALEAALVGARVLLLNNPNNPTGKVYTAAELRAIALLCNRLGVTVLTDEVYEQILFDGARHSWLRLLDPERTIKVTSVSKTLAAPGCRIGWIIAPRRITAIIRAHLEQTTAGICSPSQRAVAAALQSLPESFYRERADRLGVKRDRLAMALRRIGLDCAFSNAGYFLVASAPQHARMDVLQLAGALLRAGLSAVPGRESEEPADSRINWVRVCFARSTRTLDRVDRLVNELVNEQFGQVWSRS